MILIKTLLIIVREGLCSRFDTWILDERIFWSLLIEKKVGVSFSTGVVTVFDLCEEILGQNLVDNNKKSSFSSRNQGVSLPSFFYLD